jgi:hypothetical protein
MKQTVVPAQITTVEDRIVGNLGIGQVVLLALPVLAAGVIFGMLPPIMHLAVYKLLLVILIAALSGALAIRIKGKILLFWVVVRVRYNVRPGFYVFNKNTVANRELYETSTAKVLTDTEPEPGLVRRKPSMLTTAETIRAFEALDNPAANVSFAMNKKGNLYVRITEVKQEG